MNPIVYDSDKVVSRKRLESFWGVQLDIPGDIIRFSPTQTGDYRLLVWHPIGKYGCWLRTGSEVYETEDLPPEIQ